ncbi:hypothetical protein MSAR_20510 [Mycolicibacterium sarraceniae]|uniref:GH64 domain-containing protein n=1 Tax=Mycolicibacterium sarraceniae TaxID=1534348 RepID=A0A7I7SS75_9MYCO|nr:hypothetical protein MSAR_20510 [Mycolicibacterium sarraceniae]
MSLPSAANLVRSVQAAQRNWFQRTFEAVTPALPPQTRSEALDHGETSDPFPLGGVDTDGRGLTDAYTDTFKVTNSDFWSGPHTHGLSALVNLLTFGLFGSSGHAATGTVTIDVVPHNAGTYPVNFVNNSPFSSGQVYVTVVGQISKDHWAWVDQNGTAHAINNADANAPGHLVEDGVNYANMSYTLDQAGNLRMPPELQGDRIYVSINQPLHIAISPDNTG